MRYYNFPSIFLGAAISIYLSVLFMTFVFSIIHHGTDVCLGKKINCEQVYKIERLLPTWGVGCYLFEEVKK